MKTRLLVVVLLALVLVNLGLLAQSALPTQASPNPQAGQQFGHITLLTYNAATTAATGEAFNLSGWKTADCYSVITMTGVNTTTVRLQHAPDGKEGWYTAATFSPVTSTADFTTTTVYGTWLRATISPVTSTIPITGSVVCDVKDRR